MFLLCCLYSIETPDQLQKIDIATILALLIQVWRWWRTGKPGMLQFTGSQRVRHDWATEQQQIQVHDVFFFFPLTNIFLHVTQNVLGFLHLVHLLLALFWGTAYCFIIQWMAYLFSNCLFSILLTFLSLSCLLLHQLRPLAPWWIEVVRARIALATF